MAGQTRAKARGLHQAIPGQKDNAMIFCLCVMLIGIYIKENENKKINDIMVDDINETDIQIIVLSALFTYLSSFLGSLLSILSSCLLGL